MMFFAAAIALLPFMAAAAPTSTPSASESCTPNFESSAVKIRNQASGKLWTVPEHATAGISISSASSRTSTTSWDFVNDTKGKFRILLHNDEHHNLLVSPGWHGNAVLKTVRAKNNAGYEVKCSSCFVNSPEPEWASGATIALGCQILNVNGTALQAQEESAGNIRFDKPGMQTTQLFDLIAA